MRLFITKIRNDDSLQAGGGEGGGWGVGGSKRDFFLLELREISYLRGPLPLGLGSVECRHPIIIHGLLLR